MRQTILTANEMKAVDKNAAWLGMSPLQLMENAGHAVSEVVAGHLNVNTVKYAVTGSRKKETFETASKKSGSILKTIPSADMPALLDTHIISSAPIKVLFFAGLGNNGGDTFVAARHLADLNISSVIFLFGTPDKIKTREAQQNYNLLSQTSFVTTVEINSEFEMGKAWEKYGKEASVIVDGIFGTGFSGEVKGMEKAAISQINSQKKKRSDIFVLSVDIPSGLMPAEQDQKDQRRLNTVVKADTTVTFHKMKTFLETPEAIKYAGNMIVKPIGIPENAEKYIGPGDFIGLYHRENVSRKGDSGKVLVISGGPYTGAPALAGMAALRTGCDIVTLAVPKSIYEIVASFSPELIVKKLTGEKLSIEDIPTLKELIAEHDVVVVGPGLGKDPEVLQTVAELIPEFKKAVIDADALRPEIFAAIMENKKINKPEIVITPHFNEFSRAAAYIGFMLPKKKEDMKDDEIEKMIVQVCDQFNVTVLLKGPIDMISTGHFEKTRYNSTGNAGMSVGGTGDILAGIVGGLLTKNKAENAACCGSFICGRAGDLSYLAKGNALIPSDLLPNIPKVFLATFDKRLVKIDKKPDKKKNEMKKKNIKRKK
ncbi:MAG: NAD(P)H-hydrate dehydratase [Methanimicrococcus sp.]|nr:NAD(P)H-hydrate dehydratase [Methanimicrococcus sp.]